MSVLYALASSVEWVPQDPDVSNSAGENSSTPKEPLYIELLQHRMKNNVIQRIEVYKMIGFFTTFYIYSTHPFVISWDWYNIWGGYANASKKIKLHQQNTNDDRNITIMREIKTEENNNNTMLHKFTTQPRTPIALTSIRVKQRHSPGTWQLKLQ